jgi:hypothetical protein
MANKTVNSGRTPPSHRPGIKPANADTAELKFGLSGLNTVNYLLMREALMV